MALSDGCILGYDEHGPLDGTPLFYFHGTPSARVEWNMFGSEALAEKLNLRVICIDRPGLGLSEFLPARTILDWPADVLSLANKLGFERFSVLGYSGGVPYSLACALAIPERLITLGVAGCVGPHDVPELTEGVDPNILRLRRLSVERPQLASFVLWLMMGLQARYISKRLIAQSIRSLPEPDRRVMAQEEVRETFIEMVREAMRSGARGAQHDMALMASPWGFSPQDVSVPVKLWQGEQDTAASPAMARYLAEVIPESEARFYAGEAHMSLIVNDRPERS